MKRFLSILFVCACALVLSTAPVFGWSGYEENAAGNGYQAQKASTFDYAGRNFGVSFDKSFGKQLGNVTASGAGSNATVKTDEGFTSWHGDQKITGHSNVWSYGTESQSQSSEASATGYTAWDTCEYCWWTYPCNPHPEISTAGFKTNQYQMGGSVSLSYNQDRSMISGIGGVQSQNMTGYAHGIAYSKADQSMTRSESFGNYQESRNGWTYQGGSLNQGTYQHGYVGPCSGSSFSGNVNQIAIGGSYTKYGPAGSNGHFSKGGIAQMASSSYYGYNTHGGANQILTNSYETYSTNNTNSTIYTYGSGSVQTSVGGGR